MTKEEFIRMARQSDLGWVAHKRLERFAALVAAYEREACAKVCETEREDDGDGQHAEWYKGFDVCVAAIRARSGHAS